MSAVTQWLIWTLAVAAGVLLGLWIRTGELLLWV